MAAPSECSHNVVLFSDQLNTDTQEEILRRGAREMLAQAIETEVAAFVGACDGTLNGIRRWILYRFPYSILDLAEAGETVVIACIHGKRDPERALLDLIRGGCDQTPAAVQVLAGGDLVAFWIRLLQVPGEC